MKRVVIVDDETIVRVTLRTGIQWEAYGYQVEADFQGGKPALEYFKAQGADLLITDIKMPDVDGISLMEQLCLLGKLPVTIVLSGYNEYELVRKAFKVGAFDYLLKSDLNHDSLQKLLETLNQKVFMDESSGTGPENSRGVTENRHISFGILEGDYGFVLFEVDNGLQQRARFGEDLKEMLQKPVLELARQLPRVASRGRLEAVDPFHYALAYRVGDPGQYRDTVLSVVRQLQSVWRDYMNLTISAAVCDCRPGEQALDALGQASCLMYLAALSGPGTMVKEWESRGQMEIFMAEREEEEALIGAVCFADQTVLEQEKRRYFQKIEKLDLEKGRLRCLGLVAALGARFREYKEDFSAVFPEEVNYVEKLNRLESVAELELWMSNYFRWVMSYIENHHHNRQADLMLRAKRFMSDNYSNPELSLKTIADYVGLNEKYFSSRFTKESGITFSACLTEMRMQKAKQLMATTDLKMYEISERVGYHNVEHFNRMFKRAFQISPGDYKKSTSN